MKKLVYSLLNRPYPIPIPQPGGWIAGWKPIKLLYPHEPETTKYVQAHTKPGTVFVDVGANVGYYSVMAAARGAHVHAIEPSPKNYKLLFKNLQRNGLHADCCMNAAGAERREANLYVRKGGSGTDSLYPIYKDAKAIPAAVCPLDDLIPLKPVHLVKIDAEGADVEVLEGMTRIIENNPDIEVLIEYSPKNIVQCGSTPAEFLERIRALGFVIYEPKDGEAMLVDDDRLAIVTGHIDLLLKRT